MDGELIAIHQREIAGQMVDTINARDVWQFVESKRKFADWIKERLSSRLYIEGEDWVIHKFVNNPVGGRPVIDYFLSIDMAKEIGLSEHNAKGQELRRWIIAREKKLSQIESKPFDAMAMIQNPHFAQQLLAASLTEIGKLKNTITEQAPQVRGFHLIAESEGCECLRETAKALQMNQSTLIDWMIANKWLFRAAGTGILRAYSDKMDSGLLVTKVMTVDAGNNVTKERLQPKVTAKGLAKLATIFGKKIQPTLFDN